MKRLVLLLVLTFVAACGSAEGRELPTDRNEDPLAGKEFRSVAVTEGGKARPLVADAPMELLFGTDGTIEFRAACNYFGIRVSIDDGRLSPFGQLWQTARDCDEAWTAEDSWLNAFFTAEPAWRLEGHDLVLATERVEIRWEQHLAAR